MTQPVVGEVASRSRRRTDPPGTARRWLAPALFLVALVGAWQLWVTAAGVSDWLLPSPAQIATAGWAVRGPLVGHTATTLVEAVGGLAVGSVVGITVAMAIVTVPLLRRALWPVIVTSQTIPVIVLAPLFAIWFGFGLQPKVVMVALITFFPITVATAAGLGGADPEHVALLRSFGAGRRQIMRLVRIPAALPDLVAGMRIAAAYAVGDAVVGEYIGGSSGLGIFIDRSKGSYRTDQMLAGVAVIAVASICLFGLVGLVGRTLTPWLTTHQSFDHLDQN